MPEEEGQVSQTFSASSKQGPVQLAMVGDCMLGRGVNQALEQKPPEYPWGDTLPVFHNAHARICNLECVLSDKGTPWAEYRKQFHFRSAAKNVATLKAAGINAVSIANNHVLDYGREALLEMLELLDRAGIAHSGAGRNFDEASRIATFAVRGRRLGLLAFTDNEPLWEATAERPGTFYVPTSLADPRAQRLINLVRKRKDLDTLIVSAHWGGNWGYTPPAEHVELAHALIDAGADMIFGHSCHVFRGIEWYKGRPILYSAGGFVDDYAVDPEERNDQSFIFLAEIEGGLPARLRLVPTVISWCQALIAPANEAGTIAAKMHSLCAAFGTSTCWDAKDHVLEIVAQTGAAGLARRS
jgi:poly-gamma-glutamate capsule biosynthesis protein CapA/YwtB (metallophosphatase superfamily)